MGRKWTLQQRKAFGEMMAQRRAAKKAVVSKTLVEVLAPQKQDESLSKTDQKFESLRPGWYDFVKDGDWVRMCKNCGDGFRTRLEFNAFCSPNCRNAFLKLHETRGA